MATNHQELNKIVLDGKTDEIAKFSISDRKTEFAIFGRNLVEKWANDQPIAQKLSKMTIVVESGDSPILANIVAVFGDYSHQCGRGFITPFCCPSSLPPGVICPFHLLSLCLWVPANDLCPTYPRKNMLVAQQKLSAAL